MSTLAAATSNTVDRPLRLLLLIHRLPPESVGGSELQAVDLARQLARRHYVSVFAGTRTTSAAKAIPGVTIYQVKLGPSGGTLRETYRNTQVEEAFRRFLVISQPDIVHVHGLWGLSNMLPIIAAESGASVVFTLHDYWLMCPRGQRLRPSDLSPCMSMERQRCEDCLAPWIAPPVPNIRSTRAWRQAARSPGRALRVFWVRTTGQLQPRDPATGLAEYQQLTHELIEAVDVFVAPSKLLMNEFRAFGVPSRKMRYLVNGIRQHGIVRTKTTSTAIRFAYLGSLLPSKGVHILLRAFSKVAAQHATLDVYGAEPVGAPMAYTEQLSHLVRTDPRITLKGPIAPGRVGDVFKHVDVLVVPSLWFENCPLTIQEALASGTPIIASDFGALPEFVQDGVNGLLFARGDVEALTRTMERVIGDASLLRRLSDGAHAGLDISESSAALEHLYGELVANRGVAMPAVP